MKKTLFLSIFALILPVFFSCTSVKEVPQEKTAAQIIQMGQNSVTAGDYKSAEICYKAALERFGTQPQVFAEAKYELGNVYLKEKKYDAAYTEFSQLLSIYDENPVAFPSAYKKLANIGISKIPESKIHKTAE